MTGPETSWKTGWFEIDWDRERRTGIPEVVLCASRSFGGLCPLVFSLASCSADGLAVAGVTSPDVSFFAAAACLSLIRRLSTF